MKTIYKVLLWILGILLALCLLLMALSPVAKYVVNNYGEPIVGRSMHAERVFINPLVGSVTISDFVIYEDSTCSLNPSPSRGPEGRPFASFDRLYVRVNLLALPFRHVNVGRITLDNFNGSVVRYPDRFNFTSIIDHFSSDSEEEPAPKDTTESSSSWRISLQHIDINDANLTYRDAQHGDEWGICHINVGIPGLYFGGEKQSNAGLTFELPTGGSVGLTAGYRMDNNRYAVTLNLDKVNTDIALPILDDMLNIRGLGAIVSGSVHADGGLDRPDDVRFMGNLRVDQLDLRNDDNRTVLAFDSLRVGLGRINLATMRVALDTITLDGLVANYKVNKDGESTLDRLLKSDAGTVPEVNDTMSLDSDLGEAEIHVESNKHHPSHPLHVTAKLVQINGRKITYEDRSMSPEFEYTVSNIKASAINLTNRGDNDVALRATLGKNGLLDAHFRGGLNLHEGQQTIDANLRNVDVTDFSPFTESLMAYPLENGVLSFRDQTTIFNGDLLSNNRVEIQDMEVGRKKRLSSAPYKAIPLKLGVGLLKSSKGLIVLDLPVTGNINSPKFNLKKVILRVVGKVFLGPLMGVAEKSELNDMMELLDGSELQEDLQLALDSIQSADSLATTTPDTLSE